MQVLYKHVRGGGSEGNAYFAYVVMGGGGLEAKCLSVRLQPSLPTRLSQIKLQLEAASLLLES